MSQSSKSSSTGKKSGARKAVASKAAKKTPAKKNAAKSASAKKAQGKSAARGTKKTAPAKKTAAKKKTVAKKTASGAPAKKASASAKKKTSVKKSAKSPGATSSRATSSTKTGATKKSGGTKSTASKQTAAKKSGGGSKKRQTPIVFSLDDVRAVLKDKDDDPPPKQRPASTHGAKAASAAPKKNTAGEARATESRSFGAASLSDILGYNPAERQSETELEEASIPQKWRKYYDLLIELREHVKAELDLHTSDTLKHSSRDDTGDLSGYGQHQADAGTESFDRDFALSLVSNEQEALQEIEEAIQRIKNGSYGVCEITGQTIPKERLTAVPFTRFSLEGQMEFEKSKRRKVERGGVFHEGSGDVPPFSTGDDSEED